MLRGRWRFRVSASSLARRRRRSTTGSVVYQQQARWLVTRPTKPYSTTCLLNQSAVIASIDDEDEEERRYLNSSLSQLLTPQFQHIPSQLDPELGDTTTQSDDPLWGENETAWNEDDDERIEEQEALQVAPKPPPSPPGQKSIAELLANFDPQNPPRLSDYKSREEALEAFQLWLECGAQQEAVLRYQKVLDDARGRKDFGSLNMVQQQIVRWFKPLEEAISERQRQYITKENDDKGAHGRKKFGPYLCALPAAKLAVITAHEAIMTTIVPSYPLGSKFHGRRDLGSVPFLLMCRKIGQAVEDEVAIHRMLHKRFVESQKLKSEGKPSEFGKEVSRFYSEKQPESDETDDSGNANESSLDDDMNESGDGTKKLSGQIKWNYATSHLKKYLNELSMRLPSAKKQRLIVYALRRARQVAENEQEWCNNDRVQVGAALLQALLDTATIEIDGKQVPVFTIEMRWIEKLKTKSFVSCNDHVYKMIVEDRLESLAATTTRQKPMIVPPKPWRSHDDGGYRLLKTDMMRYHGCQVQREIMENAESTTVFDGLNALGRVKWKINKKVYEAARMCREQNISIGTDIPSRTDLELPPEPVEPLRSEAEHESYVQDFRDYRERLYKYDRVIQRNRDLYSLRCTTLLKLDQAEMFKDFDAIYFPYNVDFRGRAYPVPPHFSNVGSDLCRGLLTFAEEKPLGERGLYWLKVHLANFAGMDKITFDDRAKFIEDNLDHIRASATDPMGGDRWWMSLDDPFQGLATCIEIINAIDSGDPATYMCSLPVHMDGSCNGLQHYAALGRDTVGGIAVNLCDMDKPQDVYVGVMHEVIRRVAQEAEREVSFDTSDLDSLSRKQKKEYNNNRAAKLVNGLIDRGVVKRTVMTSVYGVTYIGARQQIQEKIEEKFKAAGHDIDELSSDIFRASSYLAEVTMDVIGDLFMGAKGTMNWLAKCAHMITQSGQPVAWISPIGLPAVQPYRQLKAATLVTLLQTVSLVSESDDLPVHKPRQVSAFPPNFIHSLDSSHMLLTALEMDRRGLTFSAVHDSFWTHACDIDEMNVTLRDVFVDLYSQPLLEELKATWELRYPDLNFPDLPQRGDLDLNEVKRAKYFFQ